MKIVKSTGFRVFLFLLLVLLTSSFIFYWVARKPIRKEIQVEYAVTDPAFVRSINGLLGTPFVDGNKVTTLVNGDEIFSAMLEAIRSAKKTITFETYIWSHGKVGDDFKKALTEKARAGVKVYVVVDGM